VADYGIPYMGSKQSIADEIVKIFPKAENFYDLFGGGFSITHAMLERRQKDFRYFYFNEIKSDIVTLIQKAIAGDYNYDRFQPEWVSRKEFLARLDDPYIRVCWSFGNNQRTYMFSKEIEPYKRSMHNAAVFNNFDALAKKVFEFDKFQDGYGIYQRRMFLRSKIEYYRLNGIPEFLHPFLNEKQAASLKQIENASNLKNVESLIQLERLQQLEQLKHAQQLDWLQKLTQLKQLQQLERLQLLQQLEHLERLERVQNVERLQKLNFSSKSYDEIEIKPNSIVYCDPPYKGTADYGNKFNTEKFLDWADAQTEPVFISEYNIADKRFLKIKSILKESLMDNSADKKVQKEEKIYINKAAQTKFLRRK